MAYEHEVVTNHNTTTVTMTNQQKAGMPVEEGNRLIAEFDGWKISKSGKTFRKDNYSSPYRVKDIQYHSSWDWLMPVWKKLGGLLYEKRGDFDKEQYSKAHVYTQHILRAFQTVEIETAFYFIAETIQWYNTQTSNQ